MAVIGKIRQNVGLLVLVVALAILAFLLMDVSSSQSLGGGQMVNVGNVEGIEVSYNDYQRKVEELTQNYQLNGVSIDDKTRMEIRENAWTQYTQELIANREYDKLGVEITNSEMRMLLGLEDGPLTNPSIRSTFVDENGVYSPALLQQYTQDENFINNINGTKDRWRNFEKQVITQRLRDKYIGMITNGVYVPEWQAKQAYANTNRTADVEYIFVPFSNIPNEEVSIADGDLKQYLNANKAKYERKEGRDIKYVKFDVLPTAEDTTTARTEVSELLDQFVTTADAGRFVRNNGSETPFVDTYQKAEEISSVKLKDTLFTISVGSVVGPFYESGTFKAAKLVDKTLTADSIEVRQIYRRAADPSVLAATKLVIDSLKNLLDSGTSFATIAESTDNNDLVNKSNGGNMGYIKPGKLPFAANNAVFFEQSEGNVFTVQDNDGWRIIEILDKNATIPAVKVAYLTRNVIASDETQKEVFSKARQFASKANKGIEAFEATATEMGVTPQNANDLGKNAYDIPGLGIASEIVTWAYQNSEGDVSSQVFLVDSELKDGTGRIQTTCVIPALIKVKPAGIPSVEDIRGVLEAEVRNQKKGEKIITQLGSNISDLQAAASATSTTVETASGVSFGGGAGSIGNEPKVQAVISTLASGEVSKPIIGTKGVYVVKTTNINEAGDPTDLTAVKRTEASKVQSFSALQALTESSDIEDTRYKIRR